MISRSSSRPADRLALRGGSPVRAEPLPPWPLPDRPETVEAVAALLSGRATAKAGNRLASTEQKELFEKSFADYCGTRFAVAVSTGTVALDLSIEALALPTGGVVIAANYGHPSTVRRAAQSHRLLLLDVAADSLCLSPDELAEALPRYDVRCVITTHFAGQPGGIERIASLCEGAGVPLIEDASHAHGAAVNGRRVGSFGKLGCFSLHSTKNLAAGEGGIITTWDEECFPNLWRSHDIGRNPDSSPYDFVALGGNYRLAEINALLALHRLNDLEKQNAKRMAAAEALRGQMPADCPLELLPLERGVELHAYHLLVARYRPEHCSNLSRARFILAMCAEGILCNAGWPAPLSKIGALKPHVESHNTPVADGFINDSVYIDQRLLLEEDGVGQILEALAKIKALAGTMRR